MRSNYHTKLEVNMCYHIYNRSVGDTKLFIKESDYSLFLTIWEKHLSRYLSSYAYCLIPNHFHFLVKCKKPNASIRDFIAFENTIKAEKYLNDEIPYNDFIVSQFKRVFSSFSSAMNLQRNRTGSLWQNKFKRIFIRNSEHFRYMLLYIHHNGIHHKLVSEYIDWPYSSFHAYLNDSPGMIATAPVFSTFSDQGSEDQRKCFLSFHEFHKSNVRGYPNFDEAWNLED